MYHQYCNTPAANIATNVPPAKTTTPIAASNQSMNSGGFTLSIPASHEQTCNYSLCHTRIILARTGKTSHSRPPPTI